MTASSIGLKLGKAAQLLPHLETDVASGRLTKVSGLVLEVIGCDLYVGQKCKIQTKHSGEIEAEVIGFSGETSFLMPYRPVSGLYSGAPVRPQNKPNGIVINDDMKGRIFDGLMEPLDDGGHVNGTLLPLENPPLNPLNRNLVEEPLDVGVRSINSILTPGKGQRLGLFAGAGLGKSVLMGMITRFTNAEVIIVGLIGERGREVREFIEHALGPEGRKRSIVITAPADQSPLMRIRAAETCHRIAEHYRDSGKNVLLLMDSLTRYAQACRELALSLGEPPATKGYPPSVFASLTRLAERSGNSSGEGSMTAIYTVLAEGDDHQDPIADAAKAILDGHVVLSRDLAERGLYPAIDINASISRVMTQVTSHEHQVLASKVRRILADYNKIRELITFGGYKKGSDPELDWSIEMYPAVERFLQQGMHEPATMTESIEKLAEILNA